MNPQLFPPPLKKGDTIGIVAPAGQLQDKMRFIKGIRILHEMGFQVKFPKNLWPGSNYLADSDENRAHEFNRLLLDDEVKGLISLRGGYGCLRMLGKIDLALVAKNPKILVGFSDISVLQNYLFEQTGLVSLHGPVVTSLCQATKDTLVSLYDCLTQAKVHCVRSDSIKVLRDGPEVSAPLIGGNLTSLVTLLGTGYDFSWDNKIVFLEDINEPIYKIDRMLTQLKLAGKFNNIVGLVLGDFSISTDGDEFKNLQYRESVRNRILEVFQDDGSPVWGDFPSGHCNRNLSFFIGATAEMKRIGTELHFQYLAE